MNKVLGDIAKLQGGYAYKSRDLGEVGLPVVKIGDVTGGGSISYGNMQKIPLPIATETERFATNAGDTLISMTGANVGKVARVGDNDPAARINQRVGRFVPIAAAGYCKDYIHYIVSSKPAYLFFANAAYGSAQPNISGALIESLPVPEIEPNVANKIGKMLASLDHKIELNRRMNETLEEMARALFRDWFVDFGPTRRQAEGATDPAAIMGHALPPEKAATLAPLFPARLGDEGLPEGWEMRPLSTVVEQQKQSVRPDQHLDEVFEHFSLPAFDKAKWPAPELGSEIKSNKTAVPENALLVSKLNPRIERVWVPQSAAQRRHICSTEFLCFKPAPGLGLATVEALFRSDEMREKMASMVTGTSNSHQRVPPKVLMQTDVLLPEVCGAAFEEVTLPLLHKRQSNEKENQTLTAIRDLLLPKLMSGEIRLKDAERCA